MKMKMTLDEFIKEVKDRTAAFETMWKEQHKALPDQYPLLLWGGDWWEQFDTFDEEGVKNDT
jgi:hypothetical protein